MEENQLENWIASEEMTDREFKLARALTEEFRGTRDLFYVSPRRSAEVKARAMKEGMPEKVAEEFVCKFNRATLCIATDETAMFKISNLAQTRRSSWQPPGCLQHIAGIGVLCLN